MRGDQVEHGRDRTAEPLLNPDGCGERAHVGAVGSARHALERHRERRPVRRVGQHAGELFAKRVLKEEKATDYVALQSLQERQAELEAALEEKMERWVYLNDLAEQISNQ